MKMNIILTLIAAAALMLGAGTAVHAQAPGDGPPPDGGGFGGGFGGGPRGGGRMHGGGFGGGRRTPPPLSAATVPVAAMTDYLKLTADQQTKIAAVGTALREQMRPPRPAGAEDGTPPPPPPAPMDSAARDAAVQKASDAVTALLDATQKAKLTTLLNALKALRADRIRPETAAKLKLADDQITRLAALGISATARAVEKVLTDEQSAAAEKDRPTRPGGGPGGGPGGPDGPGGPPDMPPPPPGE